MRKTWKHKSKREKAKIRKLYLKFYESFNCDDCPFTQYRYVHNHESTTNLFYERRDQKACVMCGNFKILDCGRACPCLTHGPEEAKERLERLLRKWRLLK